MTDDFRVLIWTSELVHKAGYSGVRGPAPGTGPGFAKYHQEFNKTLRRGHYLI